MRKAKKFKWPACEEYDRHFRQMVTGDEHHKWSTLDVGLYMECLMAQALPVAAKDMMKGG